jgi:hypothetical protein
MKEGRIMSWKLLTIAVASLLPLSVQAAETPKEGTANFTNAFVSVSSNAIQQGTRTFNTYEINGVARNDAGGTMFNMFGQRCVGMLESIGSDISDHGTCTYTDKDGDSIFTPYSGKNGHETYELAGGTGKFAGITGSGEYSIDPTPIKSDDKRVRHVASSKVSWKLP